MATSENAVTIPVDLDTKRFDMQIEEVEMQLQNIESMLKDPKKFHLNEQDIKEFKKEAEKLNNKLVDLNKQKEKWNSQDFNGLNLNGIKDATEGIIKKVLKWGLALFSIRSAYSFIRSSASLLAEDNEQIGTNIEYMRWALATAIQPIVEFIVNLAYQLLKIINAISVAIFGVNLFANATADNFARTKNNLKGSNKEAKELQKTLAGFDEMNIINDNGGTSVGGGGGGVEMPVPDVDFSQVDEGLVNMFSEWKEKFLTFWDDVIDFWENDWWNFFSSIGGDFGDFFAGIGMMLKGFWEVLQGFGEMLIGLLDMLWGIITLDFDKIKEGFGILIDGLWNTIKGLFQMIAGALLTAIGLAEGIFKTFVGWIYDFVIAPVLGVFTGLWQALVNGASGAWNMIKSIFSTVASFFGSIFGNAWNAVKNIFSTGGKIFMGIVDGIAQAFGRIVNAIIGGINKIVAVPFNTINGVLNGIKNIDLPLIGKPFYGFWGWNPIPVPQIPLIPLATGGIVNMPGRGVPIAGEAGAEGVIPLTDSQAMETLGQTIGKYISLNATIPVYVGNRQIAREIRTINQESDFAFNR